MRALTERDGHILSISFCIITVESVTHKRVKFMYREG